MNESQSLAEDYIGHLKANGASGAEFSVDECQIRIWQETDEDDEPDKYYIIKDDVADDTWSKLVDLIGCQ